MTTQDRTTLKDVRDFLREIADGGQEDKLRANELIAKINTVLNNNPGVS